VVCGAVLFLEVYDVASVGNAVSSLGDAWKLHPATFTQALTAGNVGFLLRSRGAGLPGDRLRRRLLIICCVLEFGVFSLLSALVRSPLQLEVFVVGGVLPIAMAPLLVLLPNAAAKRRDESRQNPVAALFRDGLAPTTLLLWSMNLLSMLVIHFFMLWMPAILHSTDESSARSILAASMYSLGALAGSFITAPFMDKVGIERVLTCALALGAF
jgi:MFS family permease